jgi:hypothetical protein
MDEAWFHLSGYINSQNSRIWSAENPHALHENPLHLSESVFGAQCLENELGDHCFLKRWRGIFSICCNYTLLLTFLLSLKK